MGVINSFLGILAGVDLPALDPVVGSLLQWMDSWILNLGLTVILFTVLLKLITFPLDFFSRRSMKIYQLKMEKIQPQLDKIKKQYANNPQLMRQKQAALQRKMGASALASCLPTIVTLALFIYVFSALTSYVNYSNINNYNILAETYNEVIEQENINADNITQDQKKILDKKMVDKYLELNNNFLWVKNIGVADAPWLHPIADDASKFLGTNSGKININNDEYKAIMAPIINHFSDNNGNLLPNGFLILPILAVGLSVLSQLVTMKQQKNMNPMGEMAGQKTTMKIMMIIFPIMFLTFALTSSTAFTIYMTMNTSLTLITTFLINFIVKKTVKLKERKQVVQGVGRRENMNVVKAGVGRRQDNVIIEKPVVEEKTVKNNNKKQKTKEEDDENKDKS